MPRRGERHHKAKLSDSQVKRMRFLRHTLKWTYRRVAEEVSCSIWTARDICDFRTRPL